MRSLLNYVECIRYLVLPQHTFHTYASNFCVKLLVKNFSKRSLVMKKTFEMFH